MDGDGKLDLIDSDISDTYRATYGIRRQVANFQFERPTKIHEFSRYSTVPVPATDAQGRNGLLLYSATSVSFQPRGSAGAYRVGGPWSSMVADSQPSSIREVRMVDMDGNGTQEAVAITNKGISVMPIQPNAPVRHYALRGHLINQNTWNYVDFADANGDGRQDVFKLNYPYNTPRTDSFSVAMARPGGGFEPYRFIASSKTRWDDMQYYRPDPDFVADVDGDGNVDLVALLSQGGPNRYRMQYAKGNGDGTFQALALMNLPAGMDSVVVAGNWQDMDGNGLADMVFLSRTPKVVAEILWQTSPGNYQVQKLKMDAIYYPANPQAGWITPFGYEDMNGDGWKDVVIVNHSHEYNSRMVVMRMGVYMGGPAGIKSEPEVYFDPAGFYSATGSPVLYQAVLHDYDQDGMPDLVGQIVKKDDPWVNASQKNQNLVGWSKNRVRLMTRVQGKIFGEKNTNCTLDANEKGLSEWSAYAEPFGEWVTADPDGSYLLFVDTASTRLGFGPPAAELPTVALLCQNGQIPLSGLRPGQTLAKDLGAEIQNCHFLMATMGTAQIRPCSTSQVSVNVLNRGSMQSTGTLATLQIPAPLRIFSANVPFTTTDSLTYTFDLDTIAAGMSKTVLADIRVACNLEGMVACMQVAVTPPSNCTPTAIGGSQWDGSNLEVHPRCTGSNGAFAVINTGLAMGDSALITAFSQNGSRAIRNIKLSAGDSVRITPASLGLLSGLATYMVARQSDGNPYGLYSAAMLPACGSGLTLVDGNFGLNLPQSEGPGQASVCEPIRNSFDPNDKAVSPAGIGPEKRVLSDGRLTYKIRFENTGSDTAYSVVIVDSLDNSFDLATIQQGAASSTFEMDVARATKGRAVVAFRSKGIRLPYRAIDSVKAQGFISFSIRPKAGLAQGTQVRNFADIYFDHNAPIRTNTVQVTLSDSVSSPYTGVKEKASTQGLAVWPNPATSELRFALPQTVLADGAKVRILSPMGGIVKTMKATGNTIRLNGLAEGAYILEVATPKGPARAGFVVQK